MMFGEWGTKDHDESIRIIHHALDAGINFVDTADVYSAGESEVIVGKALAGGRDDIVLATKAFMPMGDDPNQRGNSRRWIVREVENSLRRLGTDWIDLYQIHRPDPKHRHRRNPRRADRPGPPGQDPLHRPLDLPRLGDRRGAVDRRAAGPRTLRRRAAAILDPDPGDRARRAADLSALRDRRHPLQPARRRLAIRPLPHRTPPRGRRRPPASAWPTGSTCPAREPAQARCRRAARPAR